MVIVPFDKQMFWMACLQATAVEWEKELETPKLMGHFDLVVGRGFLAPNLSQRCESNVQNLWDPTGFEYVSIGIYRLFSQMTCSFFGCTVTPFR